MLRRASFAVLVASLNSAHPSYALSRAQELIQDFPSAQLFTATIELNKKLGRALRLLTPTLEKAAGKDQALKDVIARALKGKKKPRAFKVTQYLAPSFAKDLTAHQRKLLEKAANGLEGRHGLTAEQLLGNGYFETTGSLRGLLEITELPQFDDSKSTESAGSPRGYETRVQIGLEGLHCKQ